MRWMAFAVVALVGFSVVPARADTLPIIEGVPGTYTPGQTFTFEVRVPQLVDLSKYVVELDFSTTVPNPSLFVSATAADPAPSGRYVFPSNANFQSTSSLVSGSTDVALTFTDATSPPLLVVPGTNDTLVTVKVQPGADLTGPITISVGGDTQFDFNTEFGHPPPPEPIVVLQADVGPSNPVPAPSGAVLLGIGGLLLGVRSRFRKPATTSSP